MDIKQIIINYISSNIVKASSFIFLLFGGLIFFIYFLYIKYLPDLNLISSVTILAFASVTGLMLLLSTILMLIFPGLFWKYSIYKNETITNVWSDKLWKILAIFVIPILSIYATLFASFYFNQKWIIFLNLLWILGLFIYGLFKNRDQNISLNNFLWNYLKFIILSFYGSLISMMPIFVLSFVFLNEYIQDVNNFIGGFAVLTMFIVIANILVINKPNNTNYIYWYSTLGLISFLIVSTLTNQSATFPKAIMKTYKLGHIKPLSVIVDKQGCNLINKSLKFHKAKNEKGKIEQFEIKEDTCIVPNMYILSRIGNESYVEIDKISIKIEKKEIKNLRFPILSSSIKTWNLTDKQF